jgi:hypothetical protein
MTIIGLGNAGCNIAEKFENIGDDTKVILIDADIEGENCISLKRCDSPEAYEQTVPDITDYLELIDERVFLIVGGSGKISGASLKILKQLRGKELNVIYIRPDVTLLQSNSKLQDNLVFNVFQEYARSGIFKKCYLINNNLVEKILGDVPVIGYYEKLNDLIFNALGFVLTHETKNGLVNNLSILKETERICTVGFFDINSRNEELFYELENIDDKHFYFVINEEKLKTDGSLLKKIKQIILEKSVDNIKCSYTIHSTKYEQDYCFVAAYTKRVQK